MRRLLLPILFFPILFAACKQEDDDAPTPEPTPAVEVSVSGISPVVLEQNNYATLSLNVNATGGRPVTTLSVSNLPQGVSAYVSQQGSQPPFAAEIGFQAGSNAVAGTTDTAILTVSPTGGTPKTYSLPITINSCVSKYTGAYNVVQNCGFGGGGTSTFTSDIIADSAFATRVRILNFRNAGTTIFAEVDCSFSGFTIPLQAPSGANFTVQGGGSLNGSSLSMNYTITPLGSSTSSSCTASYTR